MEGGGIICPGHRMILMPACLHLSHLWESVARQKCFLWHAFQWRDHGEHPGVVSLQYLIQCVTMWQKKPKTGNTRHQTENKLF